MIKLKIPQFWYSENTETKPKLLTLALWPLSYLYQFGSLLNRSITIQYKSSIPVICVGNLTLGGGGKTPASRAFFDLVKTHGKFTNPCFLMRGYGGNISGAVEVNIAKHTTWDVGDEALMQARYAPVIVSKNRKLGAELAEKRGYNLIIMDDGFQNYSLAKDVSFIIVDGGFGFGNGLCFPSGPLREPVSEGIQKAQAAIIINRPPNMPFKELKSLRQFDATVAITTDSSEKNPSENKNVTVFAGIARPTKFFETLEHNGYVIDSKSNFPDHHIYTHDQLSQLHARSQQSQTRLLTTEKDWVRLSENWKKRINYLRINIVLNDDFQQYFKSVLDEL